MFSSNFMLEINNVTPQVQFERRKNIPQYPPEENFMRKDNRAIIIRVPQVSLFHH